MYNVNIFIKDNKVYEDVLVGVLSGWNSERTSVHSSNLNCNTMNWENLGDCRCPRCSAKLETHGMLGDFYSCTDKHCLFKIGAEKFAEMSGRIRTRREASYDPDENLSALNNL